VASPRWFRDSDSSDGEPSESAIVKRLGSQLLPSKLGQLEYRDRSFRKRRREIAVVPKSFVVVHLLRLTLAKLMQAEAV
jgi:hypothetical protein